MELAAQLPRVPPDRRLLLLRLRTAAWLSAVTVSMAIGTWINLQAHPPLDFPSDRIESLRASFAVELGDRAAADQLLPILEHLPADRPVLVVRDPSMVLGSQLISYAAWPRSVTIRDFPGSVLEIPPEVLRKSDFSAIVVCGPQLATRPQQVEEINRRLTVIRLPSSQP